MFENLFLQSYKKPLCDVKRKRILIRERIIVFKFDKIEKEIIFWSNRNLYHERNDSLTIRLNKI